MADMLTLLAAKGWVYVVPPSGDTTGVTDFAAINGKLAAGKAVLLSNGTYWINALLSIPSGGALLGPPGAVNTAPTGPDVMPAIIKLAANSNTHMINISGNNTYVGNLELDGNKANQSSGFGNGILFNGFTYAVFERVFVHDQRFRGINGVSGVAARVIDCAVSNNGEAGIVTDSASTDWTVRGCYVNNNTNEGLNLNGFVHHIYQNDIWNNGTSGIKLVSGGRSFIIMGNGIDHNQQHGIVVQAPGVSIVGNSLHSNGLAASATYNSITVDQPGGATDGVTVANNHFWLDGGVVNKVAYHISYSGTVVTKTHGNQFAASSSATGTISAASQAKDANETG